MLLTVCIRRINRGNLNLHSSSPPEISNIKISAPHTHYIHFFKNGIFNLQSSHGPLPSPPFHSSSPHSSVPLSPRGCSSHPQAFPLPGASSLLRIRHIFSHWGQTRQSSAVYVLGASYQLVHAAWLVAYCLRDLRVPSWDFWSSYTVALLLSFIQPFPNSTTEVPNFSPLVGCKYHFCWANKHTIASVIVSGLEASPWDGSQVGLVIGLPFLQSLSKYAIKGWVHNQKYKNEYKF